MLKLYTKRNGFVTLILGVGLDDLSGFAVSLWKDEISMRRAEQDPTFGFADVMDRCMPAPSSPAPVHFAHALTHGAHWVGCSMDMHFEGKEHYSQDFEAMGTFPDEGVIDLDLERRLQGMTFPDTPRFSSNEARFS